MYTYIYIYKCTCTCLYICIFMWVVCLLLRVHVFDFAFSYCFVATNNCRVVLYRLSVWICLLPRIGQIIFENGFINFQNLFMYISINKLFVNNPDHIRNGHVHFKNDPHPFSISTTDLINPKNRFVNFLHGPVNLQHHISRGKKKQRPREFTKSTVHFTDVI